VVTRLVLSFILAFVPAAVSAQVPQADAGNWDIAATTGLFAGYGPESGSRFQELWFHNVQGGITFGRYLWPHLKLELEASATNGGTQFRDRTITVPGYPYPYPLTSEATTAVRSLAASVVWQFRDNEWVHPFLQAGLSTDFDRVTVRTWEPVLVSPHPGAPLIREVAERIDGPATTRHLRGVLGGGAKVYFTQRLFIRSDGRWTFGRQRHNLALRLGAGVDF
jgi:hypothetical protein